MVAVIPARVPLSPPTQFAPLAGKLVWPFEESVPRKSLASPLMTSGEVSSDPDGVTVSTPPDPSTQMLLLLDSCPEQSSVAAEAEPAEIPTTPIIAATTAPAPATAPNLPNPCLMLTKPCLPNSLHIPFPRHRFPRHRSSVAHTAPAQCAKRRCPLANTASSVTAPLGARRSPGPCRYPLRCDLPPLHMVLVIAADQVRTHTPDRRSSRLWPALRPTRRFHWDRLASATALAAALLFLPDRNPKELLTDCQRTDPALDRPHLAVLHVSGPARACARR